jgi:hypothetical protein
LSGPLFKRPQQSRANGVALGAYDTVLRAPPPQIRLCVNSVSQGVLDLTSLLSGLAIVFQPFPGNVPMC